MRIIIITIPLISSISLLIFGRFLGHSGGRVISITTIIITLLISIRIGVEYIKGKIIKQTLKDWWELGEIKEKIELIYDKESIIMINLISIISTIVIIFSYWYLREEPHINRFISLLLLFSVSMIILVSSKNLLWTFFGWEGVGILSFLLINFWSSSINNTKAALKAFIFNRIGDIFYILGIINIYYTNISVDLPLINNNGSLYIIFFIIASIAKSAQIFLHPWLGDAMAGPTPVSALLHAATMVTAGIYLILKLNLNIREVTPELTILIYIIGCLSILFAGLSAIGQYDLKKIIAFSTCGQIGYMFFSLGLTYPINGSLYHLVTHGYFKALLFLTAGIVIHSFFLEQDLRKLPLFASPFISLFFLFGSLAIIAFPGLSGFYSKDLILFHTYLLSPFFFFSLILGSILSCLYSFFILYSIFFKSFSSLTPAPLHNYSFLLPLFFLFFGSIGFGSFLSYLLASPESLLLFSEINPNLLIHGLITLIPLFSLFLGYFLLKIDPLNYKNLFTILNKKFFFDSFYNTFLLKPFFFVSYHVYFKFIDRGLLEFFGPISLFRLFFFFPKSFSLSNQSISNTPFLFFFIFTAFFVILISYLLLVPFPY